MNSSAMHNFQFFPSVQGVCFIYLFSTLTNYTHVPGGAGGRCMWNEIRQRWQEGTPTPPRSHVEEPIQRLPGAGSVYSASPPPNRRPYCRRKESRKKQVNEMREKGGEERRGEKRGEKKQHQGPCSRLIYIKSNSTRCQKHKLISMFLPYGQHKWGQFKETSQGWYSQGSWRRRAHSSWTNQRREEAGQGEGKEDKTAEQHIQERTEGGACKCLHLSPFSHLEAKRDMTMKEIDI